MVRRSSPQVNLAEKLAKYAHKHTFFYVTLDPERALGIEDILPNYTIICPYKSAFTQKLQKDGVDALVLEENMPGKRVEEIVKRGTYGMLQDKFVQNIINEKCGVFDTPHKACVMVLKTSSLIEGICKKNKWNLLAPSAKIAEQFENKISQYKILKNKVPYPATIITSVKKLFEATMYNPETTAKRGLTPTTNESLGYPFVLQFNRGHSGNATFFVGSTSSPRGKSKKELGKLYKLFPKREVKVSEYIEGKTYTLNCLILKNGKTITGSLSEQITGLPSATNNPNTTVGNDFANAGKLEGRNIKKIQKIAENAGKEMHKKGYSGLFGIDVIIEKESGRVYFIELNTHQPASITFEAKLHRAAGKMPLLAYFILDRLVCFRPSLFSDSEKPPIVLPAGARQIIYRNKSKKFLSRNQIMKKCKDKNFISRMKRVGPNEETYRVQKF